MEEILVALVVSFDLEDTFASEEDPSEAYSSVDPSVVPSVVSASKEETGTAGVPSAGDHMDSVGTDLEGKELAEVDQTDTTSVFHKCIISFLINQSSDYN